MGEYDERIRSIGIVGIPELNVHMPVLARIAKFLDAVLVDVGVSCRCNFVNTRYLWQFIRRKNKRGRKRKDQQ